MKQVIINLINEIKKFHYQKVNFKIVQIGCGGNGTYLVQQISQMFSLLGQKGEYLLVDPDIVEKKNLRNQLFIEKDIGKTKASVLAQRYRAAYQVPISYYDKSFIETEELLEFLFTAETESSYDQITFPILIGAVDNNFSRQVFHRFFERANNILYIDVGVHEAKLPNNKTLEQYNEWTTDEKESFERSGYTGQVVAGLRLKGETVLEPVNSVYPDIMTDKDDIAPSQAACSTIVASDPQRLITNRLAAMALSIYINDLFSSGIIRNHYTVFHSRKGYMRSQPILLDTEEENSD